MDRRPKDGVRIIHAIAETSTRHPALSYGLLTAVTAELSQLPIVRPPCACGICAKGSEQKTALGIFGPQPVLMQLREMIVVSETGMMKLGKICPCGGAKARIGMRGR
jgi:hypothetical protein